MPSVSLPQKPVYFEIDNNTGKIEILGCYPGYGTTLGNALRRVLLSSLEGAAITAVKIKGISHEFTVIPGVMEDVVQIILNLKRVRIKMNGNEPVKLTLKSKGEGKLLAKDINCPTGIKIVNPEQIIATITDKKTEFEAELEVKKGLGYVPVEQQEREEKEIGVIAIDAIYTPIRRVNYEVENMRVGKRTDFNKITLEISTDGSITPKEAFYKAVEILADQFSVLKEVDSFTKEKTVKEEKKGKISKENKEVKKEVLIETVDPLKFSIMKLKNLSTRTLNVLEENKIEKVKDLVKMTEEDLKKLEGMGEKGIKEIKKAIGDFGLTLKQLQ